MEWEGYLMYGFLVYTLLIGVFVGVLGASAYGLLRLYKWFTK